jgi:hypothetical protein
MPSPNASDFRDAGERSPFDWSDTLARLGIFLDAYSAGDAPVHFDPREVIASTIDRLRALATWTAEHARIKRDGALATHAEMYLAHARWLSIRCWTPSRSQEPCR